MLEDFGTNVPEKIRCEDCKKVFPLTALVTTINDKKRYYCYPCWEGKTPLQRRQIRDDQKW